MLNLELRARFDEVRLAMERVRSGESESEQINLPSGERVVIRRDESAPIGIRIQTPKGVRGSEGATRDVVRWGSTPRKSPVAFVAGASDGVVRKDDQAYVSQVFETPEVRPPDYPDDLPFLPNVTVSVSLAPFGSGMARVRNAIWAKPRNPYRDLDDVKAQLTKGGWVEEGASQATTYMEHTLSSTFIRDGARRVVSLVTFGQFSQIILFEKKGG